MQRRHHAATLALVTAASLVAATCDGTQGAPEAPFATSNTVYRLGTDGRVELEAEVQLTLGGGGDARVFDLGAVSIVEPPDEDDPSGGPAWTLDGITFNDAAWPVGVEGELDFETRRLLVRASTRLAKDEVPAGVIRVEIREGDATHFVTASGSARQELEPCAPLSAEVAAASVDGELAWSASTIADLVAAPFSIAADPLGRVWVAGGFTPQLEGSEALTRVLDAAPGGVGSIVELATNRVAIAPGTGSGPTLTYHTRDGNMLVHRIERRDAALHPVWSHDIDSDKDVLRTPIIAASGGHVLIGVNVYSSLVLDGVSIDGVSPHDDQLVLFDATSGDFIGALGRWGTTHIAALSAGSFAAVGTDLAGAVHTLVSLAPDLSVRWEVVLDQPAVDLATTPDDHAWVELADRVDRYDPTGALVASIPIRRQGPIVPLPNGDVLVGTNGGVARATAADTWGVGTFPKASVFWCETTASWTLAPAPGGAVFVTRPTWPVHGPQDGVTLVGKIAL